ncbi:aubergine, partial [Carabus blaptoides fortunei]
NGNKVQLSSDETLSTRPAYLSSKEGTCGTSINLQANYFQLTTNTHWRLYQYRVDFVPDEDRTQVRKKILAQVYKDKLSGYIFDGSVLFTSTHISPGLLTISTSLQDDSDATRPITITLRLVGDVEHGDYHLLQVFNIIIRKCLGLLKLQVVGRNYYDARAA